MSPKLVFNTVPEYGFKMLAWQQKGIIIDGERLSHLHFADDIVILSDNLGDAKNMVQELKYDCVSKNRIDYKLSKNKDDDKYGLQRTNTD